MAQLLGPDGQPIRGELLTREIAEATTTGVRSPVAGYPADGLNPSRLAGIMRQADQGEPLRYFELAELVEERDPHYLGVLGTRKRQVSQIPVRVEAASEDKEDVAIADFVRAWLTRDELQNDLFHILDAIGKGLSFTEIIWETSEKQFWPAQLAWRSQRWFTFHRTNLETPLLRSFEASEDGQLGSVLPYAKFIVARMQAKSGLAIRSGIARTAAWAWMFKAFTAKDWAIFSQTYGQPIRVGRYQAGATEKEKQTLLAAVTNIAADCAAIIPGGMSIDFVESKSTQQSGANYRERCDWLDQQVSKLVMGQTATTDAIAGGHAVGKEHREVQRDIATADARSLQATLNAALMRPFVDLNFGPRKAYPRFVIEEPHETDMKAMSEALEKLVPLGLKVSMAAVRDKVGLPEPAGEEDTLRVSLDPAADGRQSPPGRSVPPPAASLQAAAHVHGAHVHGAHGTQGLAEELADGCVDEDWEEMLRDPVEQVRKLLGESKTLAEFRDRLAALAATIDTAALANMLADATTTARIAALMGVPAEDA